MNIEKILITCNINNIGSKKVIENNNGKFINQIDETLRFEIK